MFVCLYGPRDGAEVLRDLGLDANLNLQRR